MKKLFTFLFIITTVVTYGQQDALYSQYMFNKFSINPAYAGSRQSVSSVLLYRNQWVNINGAPESQTFSIHSPFRGKKFALGLNAINEKIGPTSTIGMFGTYAYHLPLSTGKLSMGLRGGVFRYQMDGALLDFKDKSDRFNDASVVSKVVPSFDFGLYYYTNKFYAALSATHLSQQEIGYYDYDDLQTRLKRHFIAAVGRAFVINDNLVLKPSMLAKYVDGAPVNVDVNFSALFHKVFWLGGSFRSSKDVVLITEFNITDYLRAGYSYDISLNKLQDHNSGSHELFIGFDFDISKQKTVSTRYL